MTGKFNGILILLILSLGITVTILHQQNRKLSDEKNVYQGNTQALLSNMKRMQIDSATIAMDVKELRLTLNEYELYRAADAEKIRKMGIRLKDLQLAARHELTVNAPIETQLKDSAVIRDTVLLSVKTIDVHTPYLQINGTIENNHLSGNIRLPVNLHQAVWIEHRHRFLWWRWGLKAIHQTIAADNPHVEINYSEVIEIRK